MELDALPSIILAITQQRSLTAVLQAVIDSVASQSEVALARIWLRQAGDALVAQGVTTAEEIWRVTRD